MPCAALKNDVIGRRGNHPKYGAKIFVGEEYKIAKNKLSNNVLAKENVADFRGPLKMKTLSKKDCKLNS